MPRRNTKSLNHALMGEAPIAQRLTGIPSPETAPLVLRLPRVRSKLLGALVFVDLELALTQKFWYRLVRLEGTALGMELKHPISTLGILRIPSCGVHHASSLCVSNS